jgi:D-lactate dehydrogenase
MNIAFFDLQGWEKPLLKKAFPNDTLHFFKESLSEELLDKVRLIDVACVFIYSNLTEQLLAQLPQLKLVVTRSTGFDHVDLAHCQKRGITVCNVPFYGENTVAEHTFALILSLSRNVHKSYVRTLNNDFSIEGLKGFDLKGKTLGVIGAGRIGLHVIRMARGFGMNVVAFDMHQDPFLAEVLGFTYGSLEEVLKQGDIITLHVPYNTHTHHLINEERIALMKKGALLINTSRGANVDTRALLKALNEKHLGGAGLDVIEGEELMRDEKQLLLSKQDNLHFPDIVRDHVILHMDNVVFTPHIAFYSQEALERILNTSVENIIGFQAGKTQYVVS